MIETSNHIFLIENKIEEKFLRKKTHEIDSELIKNKEFKKEFREAVTLMRKLMINADGVGLSANQAGINLRFFIARNPETNGKYKFYTLINPHIIKKSKEKETEEEGCLSIPGKFGPVERHLKITVESITLLGKRVKIEATGLLARIFQHEIDHLDGILFIDKAKYIESISKEEKK